MAKRKVPKRKSDPSNAAEKKLEHSQFRKGGTISLFLGAFKSEEELDAYLSETFPVDFGFTIDPRDAPEVHVSSDPSCPMADLLKGFSRYAEFLEPVVRALAKSGWHRSQGAVVFYNFSYEPKAHRLFNAWGKLKFVGKYVFQEKTWVPPFNR